MSAREPWKVTLPMGRPQSFAREADANAYAAQHGGTVTDTRKAKTDAAGALKAVRDDIPAEVRAAVRRRSGGRCEVRLDGCSGRATGQHHRLKRRAGVHTAENLVDVCRECHTASPAAIHRNVARSIEAGLIIPSWESPPREPWTRRE